MNAKLSLMVCLIAGAFYSSLASAQTFKGIPLDCPSVDLLQNAPSYFLSSAVSGSNVVTANGATNSCAEEVAELQPELPDVRKTKVSITDKGQNVHNAYTYSYLLSSQMNPRSRVAANGKVSITFTGRLRREAIVPSIGFSHGVELYAASNYQFVVPPGPNYNVKVTITDKNTNDELTMVGHEKQLKLYLGLVVSESPLIVSDVFAYQDVTAGELPFNLASGRYVIFLEGSSKFNGTGPQRSNGFQPTYKRLVTMKVQRAL
jgi:hypothetical protein